MAILLITEIIRNAIQYSPPNATVQLVMEYADNWAEVSVIDQGSGIAPEDQAGIWDVMIQSDRDQQEQQGTRMGLPIAKAD